MTGVENARRLLLVTYHFPPSAGGGIPRVLSFARDLPRYGWVPSVLTSPIAGKAAVDGSVLETLPPGVTVTRAYCPIARRGLRGHARVEQGVKGGARRFAKLASKLAMVPDPFAPWIPFAIDKGRALLAANPHAAIVATYGPPANLLVGAALARLSGLPLVVDFRDLWSDLPFAKFPSPVHAALVRAIERSIVRDAQGVTTVSGAMSDHIRRRFGLPDDRVATVLNGFEEDALAMVRDDRGAPDRPFRICYAGAAYEGYDLTPFLTAVRRLADRGEITPATFRFHTLGSFAPDVAARHGLAPFHDCEPFVPRREMFARFADVDAFLLVEMGEYGARYGYPVKLFDYLITGKPILGIVIDGGNAQALLREANQPHHHVASDIDGLVASLRTLIAARGTPARRIHLDQPPLAAFRRQQNAGVLAELLDRIVGDVTVQPRSASTARG